MTLYFSYFLSWGNFLLSHLFHKSHNTKELIAEKSTHLSTMLSLWIVNHPLLAKIKEKGNNYKSIKIMEQKRDQLGRSPWHAIPYQMLRDRAAVSPPTSVSPVSFSPLPAHLVQAGTICCKESIYAINPKRKGVKDIKYGISSTKILKDYSSLVFIHF